MQSRNVLSLRIESDPRRQSGNPPVSPGHQASGVCMGHAVVEVDPPWSRVFIFDLDRSNHLNCLIIINISIITV